MLLRCLVICMQNLTLNYVFIHLPNYQSANSYFH